MDPRIRMRSGHGFCIIDDSRAEVCMFAKPAVPKVAIATDLTGELTPNGSECGDGELTRTLSALQRLSVEEQTTLCRKLGSGPIARNTPEAPADSPYRVVLQNAVVQGDLDAAAAALRSGADPNERDDLRHSSLHFAAAKGDVACLIELMRCGARTNVANNVGWSPLHYAVLGGHVAVVEVLLRAGAYPCFRDNHLISPLHLASTQAGDCETFRRIAELLGPSALSARDELQQTPLHVAASCGNRDAVRVLLELDADPEAKDRKGRCPGQSWLRQVSHRARADIRSYLDMAIAQRQARSPIMSDDEDEDEDEGFGLGEPVLPRGGTSVSSRSVCSSEDVPMARSMLNLLPANWGLGKKGGNGSNMGGETSFGAPIAAGL